MLNCENDRGQSCVKPQQDKAGVEGLAQASWCGFTAQALQILLRKDIYEDGLTRAQGTEKGADIGSN